MPKTAVEHGEQHRLDLRRIDVDPAGNHHVVLAVAQKEIAVLVEIADIADGHEPVALDVTALLGQAMIGEVGHAAQPVTEAGPPEPSVR
jgi:hypothetical protein